MEVTTTAEATLFETPNARMWTYASPDVNGSALAVWRTEMDPGAAGPWHTVDTQQVLVGLEGEVTVAVDGEERTLAAGDALTLPAGTERQVSNRGERPAATLTCAQPGANATPRGKEPVPIPWAR